MAYQVLARKWRPRTFEEMVGQGHVLRALVNALDQNRVHHAFLFTGTRGVGKTTLGRILAKSLNCERGIDSKPCGECNACQEIDEGRFVDLIEVDAASRTKVEDTRELLENVQYAPTHGRYKVYLIDEVHMLSNHSFNALLKTLEEPPPHVKFLLATTDPQKLPVTILSRCLQFNLKRLPTQLIADHLATVLETEQVPFQAEALRLIAHAADGSMRDALSLLDQAIAHGAGEIQSAAIHEMLGSIDRDRVVQLLASIADGDGQQLLEEIEQMAQLSPDFNQVLAALLTLLHHIALLQVSPSLKNEEWTHIEQMLDLSNRLEPEEVQLMYQIALLGRKDLFIAPDPRNGFEMVLIRMLAFRPVQGSASTREANNERPAGTNGPVSTGTHVAATDRPVAMKSPNLASTTGPSTGHPADNEPVAHTSAVTDSPATTSAQISELSEVSQWDDVVTQLALRGAARELALNCSLENRSAGKLNLVLAPSFEQLCSTNAKQRLQTALQQFYRDPQLSIDIQIGANRSETPAQFHDRLAQERHQQAVKAIQEDALVQDLQDKFNADLRPELIQPNES